MPLKEQINNDLKTALLGGDRFKGEVLRGLKAVILNEEVSQGKRDEGLSDEVIEQLVAREVKKRNESAAIYIDAGRNELADDEKTEAAVIAEYLPVQLDEFEIEKTIDRIINELGVEGPAAMGQVIGKVKSELGNSANGALVAQIVKSKLQK